QVNQGSTFSFSLALKTAPQSAEKHDFKGKKAIIVDANELSRATLVRNLNDLGVSTLPFAKMTQTSANWSADFLFIDATQVDPTYDLSTIAHKLIVVKDQTHLSKAFDFDFVSLIKPYVPRDLISCL